MTERTLEDIFADLDKVRAKIKALDDRKKREHDGYVMSVMLYDETHRWF